MSLKTSTLRLQQTVRYSLLLEFLFYLCSYCAVIYDDDITDGLIKTTMRMFKISSKLSVMYLALEKRYVFVDSVCAPMYEHFLKNFQQIVGGFLKLNEILTDFPQYFEYERCKELVLLKITRT
jgi:methyltransferase-like protein 22